MSRLPYPPPYMDIATLAEHICCSESGIEKWVKDGIFPEPIMQGGKRVWRWKDVDGHLAAKAKSATIAPEMERIREATRAAARKSH